MGTSVSCSQSLIREKQFLINQELWNYERRAEKNRLFSNQLRKGKDNKIINETDKKHKEFLKKIDEKNKNQKKKLDKEIGLNKKIFSDDKYFKIYIKDIKRHRSSSSMGPLQSANQINLNE